MVKNNEKQSARFHQNLTTQAILEEDVQQSLDFENAILND